MFYMAENGMLGMSGPLFLVLLVQIILFVLLLRRPVWAMAALIVGQLTANNYMIVLGGMPISLRFLWTVLALGIVLPILWRRGGIVLGPGVKRIIVPAVIFFIWAAMADLFNIDMAAALQYLRMNFTSLVILIILPAVVKNEKDVKRLAIAALVICSLSALFAIMQHRDFLPLYELYEGSARDGRASGLTESPVQLGFDLPVVMMPMVALIFFKGVKRNVRKLLVVLLIIMVIGLYFTLTRSGIYSMLPGLVLIVFLLRGKAKRALFFLLVVAALGFLIFVNSSSENRYGQGFGEESSATGRLVLWQAGLNVALDNPIMGIGHDRFEEASLAYASVIAPELMESMGGVQALGLYEAHNDFITVWASFGTVALLVHLWLFFSIFQNFLIAYRHVRTRFLKGFTIGCIGAVAAYIINGATHNVIDTSMLLWILAGLSIATVKLATLKQHEEVKATS